MIISASRRTDIPAFYSEWLFNRLRAGFCLVPNPFNPKNIYRVELAPELVDAVVFWTKNPAPLLDRIDELDRMGYRYYFQFTLTAYDSRFEPGVPPLEERLKSFCALSERVGPKRVIWRYDPIVIGNRTSFDFHKGAFAQIAGALKGRTHRVMISFVHYYRKTERRLRMLEQEGYSFQKEAQDSPEALPFLENLASIAGSHDIAMFTCADGHDYASIGIEQGSCVDGRLMDEIWGLRIPLKKDPGQREFCRCVPSKDIGVTDTCIHGCRYCYSTVNHRLALHRHGRHDPLSPVLWGDVPDADLSSGQMRLLD